MEAMKIALGIPRKPAYEKKILRKEVLIKRIEKKFVLKPRTFQVPQPAPTSLPIVPTTEQLQAVRILGYSQAELIKALHDAQITHAKSRIVTVHGNPVLLPLTLPSVRDRIAGATAKRMKAMTDAVKRKMSFEPRKFENKFENKPRSRFKPR
ncbi:MAG: hypothetical protein HY392_00180 [Candidatus Diapherotrites archaeon]|nr:hypothetical protein [Candidatus Diapherotrites archaeon]